MRGWAHSAAVGRRTDDDMGVAMVHEDAIDRADLPPDITFHTLPMRTRNAFITRAFEIWTHIDDIRRAIGLPLKIGRAHV